jgi:hypothetical protein
VTIVVYVGPFEAVDVEHQVGVAHAVTAYRGSPVDVPEHVAAGLLEQPSNWRLAGKKDKVSTASEDAPAPAAPADGGVHDPE